MTPPTTTSQLMVYLLIIICGKIVWDWLSRRNGQTRFPEDEPLQSAHSRFKELDTKFERLTQDYKNLSKDHKKLNEAFTEVKSAYGAQLQNINSSITENASNFREMHSEIVEIQKHTAILLERSKN